MSVELDTRLHGKGTRFRLFPQSPTLSAFRTPETVEISLAPGQVQPGPADDRMYVVDAVGKLPYSRDARPPYQGQALPGAQPQHDGHFDHLTPGTREFSSATMYATVRRVLDIWEDYFQRRIDWHFVTDFARLELIPLVEWGNAQSGYGYLEFGFPRTRGGGLDTRFPYCENFDVLAHELGHSILFATTGAPRDPHAVAVDYNAMHESAGDLIATLSALHFNSVSSHLLDSTRGNLFSSNELSRIGELSESRQVRQLFNYLRMGDVTDEPHLRSLPLTGALFDVLVEIFQKHLVARGLIGQDLANRANHSLGVSGGDADLAREFERAYAAGADGFRAALDDARDYTGRLLARTWSTLSPDGLTYHQFLRTLMRAERDLSAGTHEQTLRECFAWRQIQAPRDSRLFDAFRLDACLPDTSADSPLAHGAPAGEPVIQRRARRAPRKKAPTQRKAGGTAKAKSKSKAKSPVPSPRPAAKRKR